MDLAFNAKGRLHMASELACELRVIGPVNWKDVEDIDVWLLNHAPYRVGYDAR